MTERAAPVKKVKPMCGRKVEKRLEQKELAVSTLQLAQICVLKIVSARLEESFQTDSVRSVSVFQQQVHYLEVL